MKLSAKGLLFDYGGTIDTNGVHWSEMIWQAYVDFDIPVLKESFYEAYVNVERLLGSQPIILPKTTFRETLRIKVQYQFEFLGLEDTQHPLMIADDCYLKILSNIHLALKVLDNLGDHYPMVLVSNFYGNLKTVLREFDLISYFTHVIESAKVGIRKPDPAIYQLGIDALGLPPEEIVVIGDSYKNDIQPAQQLGCQTIWLKRKGWDDKEDTAASTCTIKNFADLQKLLIFNR